MNRIKLALVGNTWMAYHFGPASLEIVELMGTNAIPTPFTALADVGKIVAKLSKNYPGWQITIETN